MGAAGLTDDFVRREWLKCSQSCAYFIDTYCNIYDATAGMWVPFKLWPEQLRALTLIVNNRLLVILKARQLGLTWLVLCFILWRMLFKPIFTSLLFSRRETEAIYLLGDERLRGVYKRLPPWMKVRSILAKSSHEWALSNSSIAFAFPTTAGDSYTAGCAFVDEADLVPDLDDLMTAVKPTIDGGGRMILLSRADKSTPNSPFKRIYRAAVAGLNGWTPIFLPWTARPERDAQWYAAQKADILGRTGGNDDLLEQYPLTAEEALRPPELDRRIPFQWLSQCYVPLAHVPLDSLPSTELALPHLKIYVAYNPLHTYIISTDPAEGNPSSDDSAAHVIDTQSLEEVATLVGKFEPAVLAHYIALMSKHYNNAGIMVERNNHGHAVLLALREVEGMGNQLLRGWDTEVGWLTSSRSKAVMYDLLTDACRDKKPIIHSEDTLNQLASIEGTTLKAPEGENDDYAISFALGIAAAMAKPIIHFSYSYIEKSNLNDLKRRDNVLLRRAIRSGVISSTTHRHRTSISRR